MHGELIAIGDELTSGRVLNTTSRFAARHLFAAGHEIIAMQTVGDDLEMIGIALELALSRADFIIVTGGLGATSDDLTNEAVASALDRPTRLYPEILKKIEAYATHTGLGAALEKLAWLPAGAHALKFDADSAGYFLVHDGKPIFFLPGVPHEMESLLLETVITRLAVWEGEEPRQVRQRIYKILGLSEIEVNERVAGLDQDAPGVSIGYYPVLPEVHLSLTVTGDSREEAEGLFRDRDRRIRELLGVNCYGTDEATLEEVVGRLLAEQGKTVAVAESCTGGLVAHRITSVPGSSGYFLGGVVAYSNELKTRLLTVESGILERHGAVSGETARAMAAGARRATGADIAVAVTGIAGPGGGSDEKPVGTVWFGVGTDAGESEFLCRFRGVRWQVQASAAAAALDLVRRTLLGIAPQPCL